MSFRQLSILWKFILKIFISKILEQPPSPGDWMVAPLHEVSPEWAAVRLWRHVVSAGGSVTSYPRGGVVEGISLNWMEAGLPDREEGDISLTTT